MFIHRIAFVIEFVFRYVVDSIFSYGFSDLVVILPSLTLLLYLPSYKASMEVFCSDLQLW